MLTTIRCFSAGCGSSGTAPIPSASQGVSGCNRCMPKISRFSVGIRAGVDPGLPLFGRAGGNPAKWFIDALAEDAKNPSAAFAGERDDGYAVMLLSQVEADEDARICCRVAASSLENGLGLGDTSVDAGLRQHEGVKSSSVSCLDNSSR